MDIVAWTFMTLKLLTKESYRFQAIHPTNFHPSHGEGWGSTIALTDNLGWLSWGFPNTLGTASIYREYILLIHVDYNYIDM